MHEDKGALESAVSRAVEEGVRELDSLDRTIESLSEEFDRVVDSVAGDGSCTDADALRESALEFKHSIRSHLARQRKVLSTFNIAFFGRTGAGKSTLLSAFGRLDGGYVSPGESDWTTDVTEVEWAGCRLWDTPGINGWGRTRKRSELEKVAREAVEVADVVMLCFDTQSQQPSEFAKVAEWVREFGKPAIAVVNVRNLRWRHPAKVPSDNARRSLSQAVREHVVNIRAELSNIALGATPVVAIHSRRALFARATTPFKGPSESNFTTERKNFGVESLAQWSNFSVLEDLVVASIVSGGSDLRLRALREGVRGILTSHAMDLDGQVQEMTPRIEEAERIIEGLFDTLGYPDERILQALPGAQGDKNDAVKTLESLRGVPFTSPVTGRLDRHVARLLRSHLADPRADSIAVSDRLLYEAFEQKRTLDESRFNEMVYNLEAIQAAVEEVWSSKAEFLSRDVSLAAFGAAPDLSDSDLDSASLNGAAGRVKLSIARLMQAAGLAAGAGAGVLIVPGVANIWNPAGWVASSASVALRLVAEAGKYAGKKIEHLGEKEKTEARSEAQASFRHAVDMTFDRMEQDLRMRSRESTWDLVGPELRALLLNAIALRKQQAALERLVGQLRRAASSLPISPSADATLARAQSEVLDSYAESRLPDRDLDAPAEPLAQRVWLGEDWIEDTATEIDIENPVQHAAFAVRADSDQQQLRELLDRVWNPRSLERVAAMTARTSTGSSPVYAEEEPASQCGCSRPKIVFLGDYSSGKSSLIKRILIETGDFDSADMPIGGGPVTSAAHAYHVGNVCLIDTPGFQSSNSEHNALALQVAAGAALVVFVFHVNLLIGDLSFIESIANGTETSVSKRDRILYLVNRADELGVDPVTAPAEFLAAKDRKESELVAALASHGIQVDPRQVYSMSGDPFGKVGSRIDIGPSAYGQHRSWDAVGPVIDVINSVGKDHARAGAAKADLDVSLNNLMKQRIDLQDGIRNAEAVTDANRAVMEALENGERDALLLSGVLRQDARDLVSGHANFAKSRVRSLASDELHKMAEIANSWWNDIGFQTNIESFRTRAAQEIDDWFREHSSQIDREIAAAEFAQRGIVIDHRFEGPNAANGDGPRVFAGAAKGGARIAKALGRRDEIYRVGKMIGVKFRPWGAVRAAGRAAKVAPVLAVVGVAADAYGVFKGEKALRDRELSREEAETFIAKLAEEILDQILCGTEADGPIPVLEERRTALTECMQDMQKDVNATAAAVADLQASLEEIDGLLESGTGVHSADRIAQ
ncbi:GTPase [Rhodococcus coprophilus]|uniref:GTP-binding protein Der n=1 Tax=Rhodococcus coprophilus TaxID=38310 RepID=A0A2X4U456_9NOCA|nr:GTPase [Rhodococcus coprophilus]MBM7457534.1 putative GTPase [Rhodococcus coprophilus]SQI29908.1 GTP-binding protein Der [Rhodococcus coprophilus]